MISLAILPYKDVDIENLNTSGMMSHEGLGILNRSKIDCLFNIWLKLSTMETSKLRITFFLWLETTIYQWIPFTVPVMLKATWTGVIL